MTVKIGEKIKLLRRKADVTQDKLAEYLGVTPQAVSRWESEAGYPDIEILPSIANFFNVSSDELLGIDIAKNKERIRKIGDLIHEKLRESFIIDSAIDEAIKICRDAVWEFPNNYYLLSWLANCLGAKSAKVSDDEDEENEENEEKNRITKEIISIRERILEDCTDDRYRLPSLAQLVYAYKSIGEKEKALEIANKLPTIYETRDNVLWRILDGEEKLKKGIEDILILAYSIEQRIDVLANLESDNAEESKNNKEKRFGLFKKVIDIINTNDMNSNESGGLICESAQYKAVVAEFEKYALKEKET